MRIVGGKHRGRLLLAPASRDVRPTGDRARESLFNILAHGTRPGTDDPILDGAVVLDAFCGTGALGLEALSRGAARALFLDRDRTSLDLARRNATSLGESDHCCFILGDATRPTRSAEPADLVMLDPPYSQDLVAIALPALDAAGWLSENPLIIAEMAVTDSFVVPSGFLLDDDRTYGKTRLVFMVRQGI